MQISIGNELFLIQPKTVKGTGKDSQVLSDRFERKSLGTAGRPDREKTLT